MTDKSQGVPTVDLDLSSRRIEPAGTQWQEIDELREKHRYFKNTHTDPGYWVLTRHEDILEAYRDWETFTNASVIAVDPNPSYRMLPSMSDPPVHAHYRKLVNSWFAPPAVERHRDALRSHARTLIGELAVQGRTDFMADYADIYPSYALMLILGLPLEDAAFIRECSHRISGHSAGSATDAMKQGRIDFEAYWQGLIDDRRAYPRDPGADLVTHLTQASLGGDVLPDRDMIDLLVTIAHGALDTTKAQLGWCLYHLAKTPDDRAWLVRDPEIIPSAVEELLRAYPIISMARKVSRDTDFHGCPMKAGDMVLLSTQAAARDPRSFPDADQVKLGRSPNRHIAFGASRHRCLGSHLARAELIVTLEEWHRLIPDYRIDTDKQLLASAGNIVLQELPLSWL